KRVIDQDQNLSGTEKNQLYGWLDKDLPPRPGEIKNWGHAISQSGIKLVEGEPYPLTAFSKKIISQEHPGAPFNERLADIEVNLGMQPNHYNHLFEVEIVHGKAFGHYSAT